MERAVFVTGAASGTGLACAARFAREGYAVYITSREQSRADAAAESIAAEFGVPAKGYALDIRDEARVKAIFADIDSRVPVDTVVLNAADLAFGPDPAKGIDLFETPLEDFQRTFETNLVWNFSIAREAARRMRERRRGAIVFISSNTAYRAIPNRTAYCASKGGINALSKALAIDLGPYGIRSNAVLPGTIKNERWHKMAAGQIVSGALTPLGDISDFGDIAEAAWYLGSDASKNVTGAEIIVDGGMSAQLKPR